MCYYVSSKLNDLKKVYLEHQFGSNWGEENMDDYYAVSGFSHPKLPAITADGEFKKLRWGLLPLWVKSWDDARKLRIQTLNAVGNTIDSKPSFRGAVKNGKFCIIPVNGFYEWHHHENGEKYPHYIYPKSDTMFFLGGLYEQWTNKESDEVHDTFAIVTTQANERMEWIHNSKKRMPVILSINDAKLWLDSSLPFAEKKKLITPYDAELMADYTISKLITSRKENSNVPSVFERFEYSELVN